jgi:broad specificity phosphatase PhoE
MMQQQQNQPPLAILRILLVRHGLSEDNLNSIWAGHKDSPLSTTGVLQAKALGAALANQHFSAIYSSDLKRASRTAEEILQANRSLPPPPLVQTQSLREQNFGQAEGKSWSDAEFAITSQGDDRTFRFPDGESLEDVNNRMGISLRRYVLPRLEALRRGQERDEPQIVIVAHGIAIAEVSMVVEVEAYGAMLIAVP